MGRVLWLLLIALVGGIALQGYVGGELRELEALGGNAPMADLGRARWLAWAAGTLTFGSALGLASALGWLSARTLRSATFPPAGAEWLGSRRRYAGAAARRVGALGLLLSVLLAAAALVGLALTAFLSGGDA